MTLDVFRNPGDYDKYNEESKKANLKPEGWYTSVPPLTVTIPEEGGLVRAFGVFKLKTVDERYLSQHPEATMDVGTETRATVFFDFADPTSKGARRVKQLQKVYRATQGQESGPAQLLEYLKQYPIEARMYQGQAKGEYDARMEVADLRAAS